MGKEKKKRFKQKFRVDPVGLSAADELPNEEKIFGTVSRVVDMLSSVHSEERANGCTTIANFVSEAEVIPQLLRLRVVKIMGPLMLDPTPNVRLAAVGAFRNMSVSGGEETCNALVEGDVGTGLLTLLHQYPVGWTPGSGEEIKSDILLNAVHLLWNLCEYSDIAVKVVNKNQIVNLLISYLRTEKYGYEIPVAAGHCVYTVSQNNPEVSDALRTETASEIFTKIMNDGDSSMQLLLLKNIVAGILIDNHMMDAAGSSLDALQLFRTTVASTLSHSVEKFVELALEELKKLQTESDDQDMECSSSGAKHEEANDINDQLKPKSQALEKALDDIEHVTSALQLSLETTANVFSADSDSEDWEDVDEEDDAAEDAVSDAAPPDGDAEMEAMDVQSEAAGGFKHKAREALYQDNIVDKVIEKCSVSGLETLKQLSSYSRGPRSVHLVETCVGRALFCLSNIVDLRGVESVGGLEKLRLIWGNLAVHLTHQSVRDSEELLDSLTTALRTIAKKLVEANPTQFHDTSQHDLDLLFDMALRCDADQVRANVVSIVSAVGVSLAQQEAPPPLLGSVGRFLVQVTQTERRLWVTCEAIDAIFDVFGDDRTNPVIRETKMIETLKTFQTAFKSRITDAKREKTTERLPFVLDVQKNLRRFIHYKKTVMK